MSPGKSIKYIPNNVFDLALRHFTPNTLCWFHYIRVLLQHGIVVLAGQDEARFTRTTIEPLSWRERQGGNSRDKEEGDKEGVGKGGLERLGGKRRERDRSDRVAYGVVAGSRKEQQIHWLYRPSPV